MKMPVFVPAHPDATQLVELACGDVDASALDGIQRHCLVCDECARQVQALLGLRQMCGLEVPLAARRALTGLQGPAVAH